MNVYKWIIIAVQVFGALCTVSIIGKPREPMTHKIAVLTLLASGGLVFCAVRA